MQHTVLGPLFSLNIHSRGKYTDAAMNAHSHNKRVARMPGKTSSGKPSACPSPCTRVLCLLRATRSALKANL
jgi:hypothetical protein